GRWVNRDPLEEEGGLNLYAFIENGPVGAFDSLGTSKGGPQNKAPSGWEKKTLQEVENELKRLKGLKDKRYAAHIKAMEGWRKILSRQANPQGRNQNYRRARGRGNVGGLIV